MGGGSLRLGESSPLFVARWWTHCLQANTTGQLNVILTFYEIVEPPVSSPLSGIPLSILRKAVNVLVRTSRAQIIAVADGEGVRFLAGNLGR